VIHSHPAGSVDPGQGKPIGVDSVIDAIEVIPLRVPLAGDPAGAATHDAVIVVIHADGAAGSGEATAVEVRGEDLAGLTAELTAAAGQLRGHPVADALAASPLDAGARRSASAAGALETAALDLAGRLSGQTVADLLGGAVRQQVECNVLLGSSPLSALIDEVRAAAAAGFGAFKLKAGQLWRGSPNTAVELELERLAAVRWAAGGDARLRLDFNGVLAPATCELAVASLAQADLELVEQPLPASASLADWKALAGWSRTPVAADESLADPATAAALARAGVVLAIKLSTVGGPRAALALAALARSDGNVLLSSSMDTSIGIAAALHTACALPGAPLACGLATRFRLAGDVGTGIGTDAPWLALPAGPGLGVELDRAALETYKAAA
jgi:L-alanine-DL-glutamate epimerase-like enolase superfamily enzyme